MLAASASSPPTSKMPPREGGIAAPSLQACVPPRWPMTLRRAPGKRRDHRASCIRPHVAGLGHKLASTKNWKAMAAPNSAVTVTACRGVGTQCKAACSGFGRLRPGHGRAGVTSNSKSPTPAYRLSSSSALGTCASSLAFCSRLPTWFRLGLEQGQFRVGGEAAAAAEAAGESEGEGVPSPRLAYERCLLLHAALRLRSAGAHQQHQQHAMTQAWPAGPL